MAVWRRSLSIRAPRSSRRIRYSRISANLFCRQRRGRNSPPRWIGRRRSIRRCKSCSRSRAYWKASHAPVPREPFTSLRTHMGLAPLLFDLLWVFALVVGILASIFTAFLMQIIYREKLSVRLLDVCVGLLAALCGGMSSTVLLLYQRHRGRGWFEQAPPVLGWAGTHHFWAGIIAAVVSVSILYAVRGQRRRRPIG